jgi:hypothetical protein
VINVLLRVRKYRGQEQLRRFGYVWWALVGDQLLSRREPPAYSDGGIRHDRHQGGNGRASCLTGSNRFLRADQPTTGCLQLFDPLGPRG